MAEENPELDPTAGQTARDKQEDPETPREAPDPTDPGYDEEESGEDDEPGDPAPA